MTGRKLIKDRAFMAMAEAAATMSTCSRLNVGAVIVTNGAVVSVAYNGAPAGMAHCVHEDNEPCTESEHAESNAVVFAGRPKALGGTMYVTHAPCFGCSGRIRNAGIAEVVYARPYRLADGLERLKAAGIVVRQLNGGDVT